MKYLNVIDETARALAFLSRIPVPDRFFKNVSPDHTSQCAGFYPLAGALLAAMAGAVILIASLLALNATIAATLGIFALIAITGALHEDGLGDVADGFGGGATRERRLEIMKDSRLGTYGVIAVVGAVLLRITALASITSLSGVTAGLCAMLASAAVSRGAMVWLWASMPNAKTDGVASKVGAPPDNAVSIAAILALTIGVVFGIAASGFISVSIAFGITIIALLGFQKLCMGMIGGQTGDVLGASQQLAEITFLIGLATQLSIAT